MIYELFSNFALMKVKKEKPLIHNRRRNRIRLHSEGKETLLMGALVLAVVIGACLYMLGAGMGPHWAYYIVILVLLVIYGILLNFFRCPIRMFQGPTTKGVIAPAVVVLKSV